ncbi:Uncharacterised protein [Providencia stuartii]|nr:Uncharacterised protein [Providencia stuartii]
MYQKYWNIGKLETTELRESINQLIGEYLKTGKKNKYGLSVVNAVGQPFNTTMRKNKKWGVEGVAS